MVSSKASATKTIAITGSSGFIGSRLASTLAAMRKPSCRVLGIDLVAREPWPSIDVTSDNPLLAEYIRQADEVYHLAGIEDPKRCEEHTEEAAAQVKGTVNVLKLCLEYKKPVVIASSCAVYGPPTDAPLSESSTPKPTNVTRTTSSPARRQPAATPARD